MSIKLDGINCFYGAHQALFDITLQCPEGETLVLLGPSGAGKSSLLRVLNLLEMPKSGTLAIAGNHFDFAKTPSDKAIRELRQNVGMVFQQYNLWPHLTVARNIGYGLKLRKWRGADIARRVAELLRIVNLEGLGEVKVTELSGGQRQAMALVMSTLTPVDILILDEHTAALDPKTAELIMELTDRVVREKQLTAVMVTHNLRFAADYGDRLLMMHAGHAVLDAAGEEKKKKTVNDLLGLFTEISIECGN